jgi:DNA-binding NarL/FixJ family response regulator
MPGVAAAGTITTVGPTLLIVDDHDGFRATARAMLEADGFRVVGEASTGREAISLAAALQPDVVLLDVVLPDLDGFEVCERIVGRGARQVVLTSTRDVGHYRNSLERSPARGFVAKSDLCGPALSALLA